MRSLRLRLLALTSLLLAFAFGLAFIVIDRSFSASLETAERELLDNQIITLLAVAEPTGNSSLKLPYDMPEERLNTPGSGLYAVVRNEQGEVLWQSRSAIGIDFEPAFALPPAGERVLASGRSSRGEALLSLSLGVVWQFDSVIQSDTAYFALTVSESRASFEAQLARFRGKLYLAFAAVAVMILVAMELLLGWLLRPLGQIANEIEAVEKGDAQALSSDYPSELTGVARNLNALLDSEMKRAKRYQQTLANLAHSLKTPLAAARSVLDDPNRQARDASVREQLDRMADIVRYQLARPATAAPPVGRGSVAVLPLAGELLDGLDKVYRDKRVRAELQIDDDVAFFGESGDLAEVLGNLLDNAYKWCHQQVLLSVTQNNSESPRPGLALCVEDDGPGFPEGKATEALQRGTRLDETRPGSGIGLAVVQELAELYNGSVRIEQSKLSGAAVWLHIADG
ncbi:MAG: ATP-binding protein [Pseudomonadota bacterium]